MEHDVVHRDGGESERERGLEALTGTSLTFYGGVDEIGGNKFLLETDRTRVFLDFGMSFSKVGDYFSEFLQPRKLNGMGDYWALNILPRLPGVYRGDYLKHMGLPGEERAVDGVIISHAHMDHIGDVPFLRNDIPLIAGKASFGIMRALEETGSGPSEYLRMQPSFMLGDAKNGGMKRLTARDLDPLARPLIEYGATAAGVGDIQVRGVPEDHSLPGAHGVLIEASRTRIAYTGDFRFHGRHGKKSWSFIEEAKRFEPDYLLVEGTRVSEEQGTSEAQVRDEIQREIEATPELVVANWPVRDTDRLLSFYEATKAAGRALCISSKQAYVLQQLKEAGEDELPSLDDRHLRIYLPRKGWGLLGREGVPTELALQDYKTWERDFAAHPRAIQAADIRAHPRDFVVRVDFFELAQLIDLQPPKGSRYIRSITEPFDEEGAIDKARADRWLQHFGLFPYRQTHASGHASGPELWKAIGEMRPRAVIPIHTERHELFEKNLEPLGIKVLRPQHALAGGKPMAL